MGTTPRVAGARAARRPFATSWTVPSPPTAMTCRAPFAAARVASSTPCPGRAVSATSTAQPCARKARHTGSRARRAAPRPAAGLRMMCAWSTLIGSYQRSAISASLRQVAFIPGDGERALTVRAVHLARLGLQGGSGAAVGADGVGGAQLDLAAFRSGRLRDDGPAQRRPPLDFEHGLEDLDRFPIDLDDRFELAHLEHAVPRAAAQLRVDVGLEAREEHRYQGCLGTPNLRAGGWPAKCAGHILPVVPADVEEPVTLWAAHAGGARFEPRPLPAVGTHPVAWSPGERQPPARALGARNHGPPRRGRSHDLERRPRHGRGTPVDVEHRFDGCEPHHAIPRAPPQTRRLIGTQASPLVRGYHTPPGVDVGPHDCERGDKKSTGGAGGSV